MADKEIISKPFSIGAGKFDSASLAIFKYILDVRSMTVIERKVEDKLAFDNPEDEIRTALEAILATNKLDEVWAICHDMLGQPDQAQILRDWLSKPKVDTGSEVTLLTEELANGETNYHPEPIIPAVNVNRPPSLDRATEAEFHPITKSTDHLVKSGPVGLKAADFISMEHTPDVPLGNHKRVISAEGVVAQLESVADEWNVNVEVDITDRMQQRKELLESMPENLQDAYSKTVQVERRPATQEDLSKIHMEGYKEDGWHREIVNGEMTGFMIRPIKQHVPDLDINSMPYPNIEPLKLSPELETLMEKIADDWTAVEPSDRSELLHIPMTPFNSMRFEQLVIKYSKQYGFTVYRTPGGRMVDLKSNKDFPYTLDGLNDMVKQYVTRSDAEINTHITDSPSVSEDGILLSREAAERYANVPFGGTVMEADKNWKKVRVQYANNTACLQCNYDCDYALVEGYGKTRTVYLARNGAVEINIIHVAKAAEVAARKGWRKVVLYEYDCGDLHALNLAQVIVHWDGQLLPRVFESADTFVA